MEWLLLLSGFLFGGVLIGGIWVSCAKPTKHNPIQDLGKDLEQLIKDMQFLNGYSEINMSFMYLNKDFKLRFNCKAQTLHNDIYEIVLNDEKIGYFSIIRTAYPNYYSLEISPSYNESEIIDILLSAKRYAEINHIKKSNAKKSFLKDEI